MSTTLIIGGTSGLGLELAKLYAAAGDQVIVTGRTDPKSDFAQFHKLDLGGKNLAETIATFVQGLPTIDRLVYAAGFYQEGRVTDLSPGQINTMVQVGGTGLIYFMRELLAKQGELKELVTITSTSQWTPRKLEPIYNFIKAGAGHFSNSMVEDGRVGKVLVAGPAGMDTPFWDGVNRDDLDKMLPKNWVAEQIIDNLAGNYKYKFIQILRQPARIEVVESR
jgi:short-subunit dehydrogenase